MLGPYSLVRPRSVSPAQSGCIQYGLPYSGEGGTKMTKKPPQEDAPVLEEPGNGPIFQ